MALTGSLLFGGASLVEGKKRERRVNLAQGKRSEVERATRANEARRSRRTQIKEARVRQAQIENVAATTGQTGSSAAVAAGDSLTANLGTNVGTIGTALLTSEASSKASSDVLEAGKRSTLESVSNLGLDIFSKR